MCSRTDWRGGGARSPAVGWGIALEVRRLWVRFLMVSCIIFIDIILPAALWPRVRFSFWQKWIPGILLGRSRWSVRRADNLTTYMYRPVWDLRASVSWIPSGPAQACVGIASSSFLFWSDPQLSTLPSLSLSLLLPLLRSIQFLTLHFVLCCSHQNIRQTQFPLRTAENLEMCGDLRSHKVSIKFQWTPSSGFQL